MATRPAKRLRRSTVLLSDDEDTSTDSSSLPLRNTSVTSIKAVPNRSSSVQSPLITSPRKTRRNVNRNFESHSNKSLHSFFGKATEEQRWHKRAESPQKDLQDDLMLDDIIDDDWLEEESQSSATTVSRPSAGTLSANFRSSTPLSSQKFAKSLKPPNASSQEPVKQEHVPKDQQPWADRYKPCTIEELAVHHKKIADVQKWVQDATQERIRQRILVLKGPAGSGKSTSVFMITQALKIGVTSWRNPSAADIGSTSSIQQFADFLDTGAQFEALSLSQAATRNQGQNVSDITRQLLVVEEFPTITRSSGMLDKFRSILEQHLLRSATASHFSTKPADKTSRPLVLIISETLLTSSTSFIDSFTAHRLLGAELLHHPLVSVLEFNPVAPTIILKALDLVINKEANDSGRRRIPGPGVLQSLADVGDIRSAINSLEFLCARGEDSTNWSGTVASRQRKSSKQGVALTPVEQDALRLISLRGSTMDMFHAAGKILYNKRQDPKSPDGQWRPPPRPPDHLMYLYTPKVSQVDVDALLNETGTDIQTFISTLHENYALSCNGDDFVDCVDGCAQHLSDSDILNPETRSFLRNRGAARNSPGHIQSGNSDMLRQDEISFQVASRGLLFSLPFPIDRAVPPGARKQDAFKIFYPTSLRLWKPTEEIDDLVSLFVHRQSHDNVTNPIQASGAKGVASWKLKSLQFGARPDYNDFTGNEATSTRLLASRESLVMEILPYLTKIRASQKNDTSLLKKITQLNGFSVPTEEIPDEEAATSTNETQRGLSTLRQKVDVAHNILKNQQMQAPRSQTGKLSDKDPSATDFDPVPSTDEKFYISDDDISDG